VKGCTPPALHCPCCWSEVQSARAGNVVTMLHGPPRRLVPVRPAGQQRGRLAAAHQERAGGQHHPGGRGAPGVCAACVCTCAVLHPCTPVHKRSCIPTARKHHPMLDAAHRCASVSVSVRAPPLPPLMLCSPWWCRAQTFERKAFQDVGAGRADLFPIRTHTHIHSSSSCSHPQLAAASRWPPPVHTTLQLLRLLLWLH